MAVVCRDLPQKSARIFGIALLCSALAACDSGTRSAADLARNVTPETRTQIARQQAIARTQNQVAAASEQTSAAKPITKAKAQAGFLPNPFRMTRRTTVGDPTEFKPVIRVVAPAQRPAEAATDAQSDQIQQAAASQIRPKPVPQVTSGAPLSSFHQKLRGLKTGARTKPVTIVHIGDSHVASDSFTRGVRRAMQARFGDAGRGAVIPAGAFKYGVADQVKLTRSGPWRSQTALRHRNGTYGISGVNVSSSSSGAKLVMDTRGKPFDYVEAMVVTGPKQGSFTMRVGNIAKTFSARASKKGSKSFRMQAKGTQFVLQPAGGGQTKVLHWATGRERPGIRYVNFGLIGATVNITDRFDRAMMARDVAALDPDLIIYGFGTNEGFNDNLNLDRYRQKMEGLLNHLETAAPNADTLIVGPADGLRRRARGGKSCGGGWFEPKKLTPLRAMMRQTAAKRGAGFWDWAEAMGGACSANRWAASGLAARDRVHLTPKGYNRSAESLADMLSGPAGRIDIASAN